MNINRIQKGTAFGVRLDILICLLLVIATLAVYWQVGNFEFVHYDDDVYVTENVHVRSGLTFKSIAWSFTSTLGDNWHPLTWLSHILDCQLYGIQPGRHHLSNVLFHIANTLLLFLVFVKMTGNIGSSSFVAALFALHPLQVESVAWVAERKNVLSTFFWMLTMWSYLRYVEHSDIKRYLLVLVIFICGLMSKPMLVTLPFVLLLLDFWPLGRFQLKCYDNAHARLEQKSTIIRPVLEKIPFIIFAAASCVVTFHTERAYSFDLVPFHARIANAMVSYIAYIKTMLWPVKLACFYPYPHLFPTWKVAGAGVVLVIISFLAVRNVRRHPYIAVGWLWYLGTLVPVIGIVQVGAQAMADRYAYVPLIGLFLIVAWGVPELLSRWRYRNTGLAAASALLIILTLITWKQVHYWKNCITLFEHALQVTADNYLAHSNLGAALAEKGRMDEAIVHYLEALQIKPDYVEAHSNLGVALAKQGRLDEAVGRYLKALRLQPHYAVAQNNLGVALAKQGYLNEAINHHLQALRLQPDYAEAHYYLGVALDKQGRIDEAIGHYLEALRLQPDYADAHNNLGVALAKQGHLDEAIGHYLEALRLQPDDADAYNNLGIALAKQGRFDEAICHYLEALRLQPDYMDVHYNLGNVLTKQGRLDEAIDHYLEALRIKSDFGKAHNNLGITLIGKGDIKGAIGHFQEALRIQPNDISAQDNLKRALVQQKQGLEHKTGLPANQP